MQLPVFQTSDRDLMMLQTKWASILNPMIANPFTDGNLLQNVSLASGTNKVNHLLGRNLRGWVIVRNRAAATFYDTQDTNQSPALTLSIVSSGATTCDIWVF